MSTPIESESDRPEMSSVELPAAATRRTFMLAGISLLLTGCTSNQRTSRLPEPAWPDGSSTRSTSSTRTVPQTGSAGETMMPGGIVPRSQWATGDPIPTRMNHMLPVRYITVHHDGMTPFFETQQQSVAGRLDAIRRAHRNRGWGDIGYHFAIDRSGRIWQCRPANWQGAHVGGHNEGNLGVLCLGNFDQQSPSEPQLNSLVSFVRQLQREHYVPASRVKTHQEFSPTACPGRTLQQHMMTIRSNGTLI